MMKKSILATLVIMTAGFAGSALAVLPPATVTGGTVNFTGNLIPAACEVSTSSENMSIDLGEIDLATIPLEQHSLSNPVPFAINFENCDSSISTTLNVGFTGVRDTISPRSLKNQATDTPAMIALGILPSTGSVMDDAALVDGSYEPARNVTITNGAMALNLKAMYWTRGSMAAAPSAGNTLFPVTFKVKYF